MKYLIPVILYAFKIRFDLNVLLGFFILVVVSYLGMISTSKPEFMKILRFSFYGASGFLGAMSLIMFFVGLAFNSEAHRGQSSSLSPELIFHLIAGIAILALLVISFVKESAALQGLVVAVIAFSSVLYFSFDYQASLKLYLSETGVSDKIESLLDRANSLTHNFHVEGTAVSISSMQSMPIRSADDNSMTVPYQGGPVKSIRVTQEADGKIKLSIESNGLVTLEEFSKNPEAWTATGNRFERSWFVDGTVETVCSVEKNNDGKLQNIVCLLSKK